MSLKSSREMAKPRGSMSSYACFVQVIREEHRKKHPEEKISFNEFTRKCAEKWKQMTQEEKRRFDEMAELDKSRHVKEINELLTVESSKKVKRKRIKNPNEPKRAWSAFFFYCNEFRPVIKDAHPDWRIGDVAKELGKRWEICLDKDKYEKMSKIDKERYVKDMESFKAGAYVPIKLSKTKESLSNNEIN